MPKGTNERWLEEISKRVGVVKWAVEVDVKIADNDGIPERR